jgi:hypothetical protein
MLGEILVKHKKTLFKWGIIPVYDELELFLTSLIFYLLILTGSQITFFTVKTFLDPSSILIFGPFLVGSILSIYYAFSKRKTPKWAKELMILFIVLVNYTIGLYLVFYQYYDLEYAKNYLIIFPLINIIHSLLLMGSYRLDLIKISKKQAKVDELIVSTTLLLIIFFIFRNIYKQGEIIFSICLSYVAFSHRIFIKVKKKFFSISKRNFILIICFYI